MFANREIVEVYADPKTKTRKEGNARVVSHLREIEPGVHQYKVNFIGDCESVVVTRVIADEPMCTCCDPVHPDDANCLVHGIKSAHWVSGFTNQSVRGAK
jgi:hypothetical protein